LDGAFCAACNRPYHYKCRIPEIENADSTTCQATSYSQLPTDSRQQIEPAFRARTRTWPEKRPPRLELQNALITAQGNEVVQVPGDAPAPKPAPKPTSKPSSGATKKKTKSQRK
jgi:hypothetical protein